MTEGKKFKEQGIWLLRDNKPVRINIKTGITDSELTEIISKEIKEGEDLIVGDFDKKKSKKRNSMGPPRMF